MMLWHAGPQTRGPAAPSGGLNTKSHIRFSSFRTVSQWKEFHLSLIYLLLSFRFCNIFMLQSNIQSKKPANIWWKNKENEEKALSWVPSPLVTPFLLVCLRECVSRAGLFSYCQAKVKGLSKNAFCFFFFTSSAVFHAVGCMSFWGID